MFMDVPMVLAASPLGCGMSDNRDYQTWLFGMRPANDGAQPARQKPARTKLDITSLLCLLAAKLRWVVVI
jgi:hypothetical protein